MDRREVKRWVYAYQAPSGQWSARVIEGEEVAGVAGCTSPEEAVSALREQFPDAEILPGIDPATE